VEELAPISVHAESFLMELGAKFSLEVGWHVGFFLELFSSVSVGTGVSELAFAVYLEVSAQLGLLLYLILTLEL
jgi:hypothetical protein